MVRYHDPEETRRYDLMKVGVLALLLILLALTWFATRDIPQETTGEVAATSTAGEEVAGGETLDDTPPAPTSAVPVIDAPDGPQPAGGMTLSGSAAPGTQIVILVDGQPAGAAIAGVDGSWSTTMDLPAGEYVVQAQTLDNVGAVVGESEPMDVVVDEIDVSGDTDTTGDASALPTPSFNPVTGDYIFSGTAAPGDTITLTSNGMVVGTAVADESGAWSAVVPADAVAGDLNVEAADAAGNITQPAEAIQLGPRPPNLYPPGAMVTDPESGESFLPVQSGSPTLTGRAEPDTSVEVLVDGASAGTTQTDANGAWSLPVELPPGSHTVQINSLDPSGDTVVSAPPFTVVVGETTGVATGEAAGATPGVETPVPTEAPVMTGNETIAELLALRPEFSTLLTVLQTAGLAEVLAGPTVTLFAPTNDAFALLPQSIVDGLAANPQALSAVLQYHLSRGRYTAADLLVVQPATLNGRLLTVTPQGDTLMVNDALVTEADIMAVNGVIHAIDRILVPPLAEGVRPPIIDDSGAAVFTGSQLTIVGTAEPNRTILVALNNEPFGEPATVSPEGTWSVSGEVTPNTYQIVAYMLNAGALEAISRPLNLEVR